MSDPCFCSHDITDHLAADEQPCDIFGCACESFEADGYPEDDGSWRDA